MGEPERVSFLVVDENDYMRRLIARGLGKNVDVTHADSPEAARKLLEQRSFDALFANNEYGFGKGTILSLFEESPENEYIKENLAHSYTVVFSERRVEDPERVIAAFGINEFHQTLPSVDLMAGVPHNVAVSKLQAAN